MEQAALLGISEGAPLSILFAATYPDRCQALALYGSFSRFSYWFPTEEALANFFGYVETSWGTGGSVQRFAPSRVNDAAFQRWWGRNERLGASPAAVTALMRMNSQIDISAILPAVRVPTLVIHRTGDQAVSIEGGRDVAAHIPGARLVEFSGNDHIFYVGDNADGIADAIEEFFTGAPARIEADRVLATVLFTDIVGSTEKAAALGDKRWRRLLDDHHATIRRVLARFRGREVKTTGDGFLATFDGPARAIKPPGPDPPADAAPPPGAGWLARTCCRVAGHAGDWTYPDERCVRVRMCQRCGDVTSKHADRRAARTRGARPARDRRPGRRGAGQPRLRVNRRAILSTPIHNSG